MAILKTTDRTTIELHQTNNKREATQTNNHVDIVTEQITSRGIVRPVSISEYWDICLANVEHHDRIRNIGNKIQTLTKLPKLQSRPQRKFPSATKYFKLDQCTSRGQHVDNNDESSLTRLLNSVVDHRRWYKQVSTLNKKVEAVCDIITSLSCFTQKLFNQINENLQVRIQPSATRLSTANQMPIQIKGTVSVPIKMGPKTYGHTFYVLIEAASVCLLELDLLETNKCDALL